MRYPQFFNRPTGHKPNNMKQSDIARAVGVSHQTVRNFKSSSGAFSSETRASIGAYLNAERHSYTELHFLADYESSGYNPEIANHLSSALGATEGDTCSMLCAIAEHADKMISLSFRADQDGHLWAHCLFLFGWVDAMAYNDRSVMLRFGASTFLASGFEQASAFLTARIAGHKTH